MLGVMAVKHMAKAENNRPMRKESGRINKNNGLETKRKAKITPNTMVELMRLFVAPHRSSPAMTSSRLNGVAIMASNVF